MPSTTASKCRLSVVDDLDVVGDTGIDANAGEGEHARHGNGAADHDVLAGLRKHGQRVRERGGACRGGGQHHDPLKPAQPRKGFR